MMTSYNQQLVLLIILLVVVLGYYMYSHYSYKKILTQLKLRVHVNGTRGKSSTTRLIAGGLRAHGMTVCAKTTGSAAKFVEPSGNEQAIKRIAPANIKEVAGFVKTAVRKYQASAVVIECMAVTPEYQEVLERRFIQADILALTNIRADHEDIMGKGVENVARALARTLPSAGVLVTNKVSYELLQQIGVVCPQTIICDEYTVTDQELIDFPYEVIRENVQLALAVCIHAGVERDVALRGMYSSMPDVGNITRTYWQSEAGPLQIINALAANDPESTLMLWHRYIDVDSERVLLVVNCRADRKERTRDILGAFAQLHRGMLLVTGDIEFAVTVCKQLGIATERIIGVRKPDREYILGLEQVRSGQIESVFAAGNIKGCEFLVSEVV